MTTDTTDETFVPAYIAFRTLTGLVERMEREEPPARIDKSYLDNMSGGYRTQVLAALNSLGLVEKDGHLSDTLKALVRADETTRKRIIGDIIKTHYAPVLALSANSTSQQMVEAFTQLAPSVTGDTRRKAIAFFLNACQYAGVPVSRHWRTPRVAPSGKRRDPVGKGGKVVTAPPAEKDEHEDRWETAPANVRKLELQSGGVVTLGLSVDLFALSTKDREFVFQLIDNMSAYESEHEPQVSTNGTVPED